MNAKSFVCFLFSTISACSQGTEMRPQQLSTTGNKQSNGEARQRRVTVDDFAPKKTVEGNQATSENADPAPTQTLKQVTQIPPAISPTAAEEPSLLEQIKSLFISDTPTTAVTPIGTSKPTPSPIVPEPAGTLIDARSVIYHLSFDFDPLKAAPKWLFTESGRSTYALNQGATEIENGATGKALLFSGLANVTLQPLPLRSFSVSVWIRISKTGNFRILSNDDDNITCPEAKDWSVTINDKSKVEFTVSYPTSTVKSDSISPDHWHHITAVRDTEASALRLYVDGKLADETQASYNDFVGAGRSGCSTTSYVTIGNTQGVSASEIALDDLWLFQAPLSSAQVASAYLSKSFSLTLPQLVEDDVNQNLDKLRNPIKKTGLLRQQRNNNYRFQKCSLFENAYAQETEDTEYCNQRIQCQDGSTPKTKLVQVIGPASGQNKFLRYLEYSAFIADANAIMSYWLRRGLLNEENTMLIDLNDDPSRINFLNKMESLRRESGDCDVLLFQYTGHGSPQSGLLYLFPDEQLDLQTWSPTLLNSGMKGRKFFLLDSCGSGLEARYLQNDPNTAVISSTSGAGVAGFHPFPGTALNFTPTLATQLTSMQTCESSDLTAAFEKARDTYNTVTHQVDDFGGAPKMWANDSRLWNSFPCKPNCPKTECTIRTKFSQCVGTGSPVYCPHWQYDWQLQSYREGKAWTDTIPFSRGAVSGTVPLPDDATEVQFLGGEASRSSCSKVFVGEKPTQIGPDHPICGSPYLQGWCPFSSGQLYIGPMDLPDGPVTLRTEWINFSTGASSPPQHCGYISGAIKYKAKECAPPSFEKQLPIVRDEKSPIDFYNLQPQSF